MFERFTPDARQAVVHAQAEARALAHGTIGNEHLLLGLLGVERGTAARAFAGLGLSPDRAREEVERLTGRGSAPPHGQIPFEPRLRRTLDVAMSEAMSLGHDAVGTGHLALALTAERHGIAAQVLGSVAEPGVLRQALLDVMAGGEPAPADDAPATSLDVPATVSIVLGEDVRALLRRAGALALAGDASEVTVDHVHQAIHDAP